MFSQTFLEKDFKDLKEISLFQINKLLKRRIFQRFKRNFVDSTGNALANENTMNKFNDINQIITHQPSHHGYDNEIIETKMMTWYRLTKSYSKEAEKLSSELYKKLSKIKSKKVLSNQMIRLGKTLFHNRYFTTSSAEDFNDLKETLLFNIDHYEGEHGIFGELWGDFLEKKYENDIDNDESDEYTMNESNDTNED